VTTLGPKGPSYRPHGRPLPRFRAGSPAQFTGHPRKSSDWADAKFQNVLRRVDVGVEDDPAVGADEAGAADTAGRIDGAAGVPALRRLRRIA
jgi:hypothetical protein